MGFHTVAKYRHAEDIEEFGYIVQDCSGGNFPILFTEVSHALDFAAAMDTGHQLRVNRIREAEGN